MKIDSMEALLEEELKDLYDAEKQLTKALPKMVKAASSDELRDALEEHLQVTKGQVQRLEQVFDLLDLKPRSKPCHGMKGLIEEGEEAMKEDADEPFDDCALIAAAQKIEHYEISGYGTARTFAETIGNDEAAELLQKTLEEEEEADSKLTQISAQLLEAVSEIDEEDEEEDIDVEDEEGAAMESTAPQQKART